MSIAFPLYHGTLPPAATMILCFSVVYECWGCGADVFYSNMNMLRGPVRVRVRPQSYEYTSHLKRAIILGVSHLSEYESSDRKLEPWSESKEGDPAPLSQCRFLGLYIALSACLAHGCQNGICHVEGG